MNHRTAAAAAAVSLALCLSAACKKPAPGAPAEETSTPYAPPGTPAEPSGPAGPAEPAESLVPGKPLTPGAGEPEPSLTYYDARGKIFSGLSGLIVSEEKAGFELLGSFAGNWPCKAVSAETAADRLQFDLETYGPQAYTGYAGYKLKLIRLVCSDDRKGGAVFRSKSKRTGRKAAKDGKLGSGGNK